MIWEENEVLLSFGSFNTRGRRNSEDGSLDQS